jgi:hypothetical protein
MTKFDKQAIFYTYRNPERVRQVLKYINAIPSNPQQFNMADRDGALTKTGHLVHYATATLALTGIITGCALILSMQ